MQQTIATHLQMPIVTDLGKYLGMPLLRTRKTNNAFTPVVDRINNKICHWQSKLLSQAGRLCSSNLFYHHQPIIGCKLLFSQEEFLVNHRRFRFELGGSSHEPSLIDPQTNEAHIRADPRTSNNNYDPTFVTETHQQNLHAIPILEGQPIIVEPIEGNLSPFELLNLGPGLSSPISSIPSSPQNTYLSCSEHGTQQQKLKPSK